MLVCYLWFISFILQVCDMMAPSPQKTKKQLTEKKTRSTPKKKTLNSCSYGVEFVGGRQGSGGGGAATAGWQGIIRCLSDQGRENKPVTNFKDDRNPDLIHGSLWKQIYLFIYLLINYWFRIQDFFYTVVLFASYSTWWGNTSFYGSGWSL